MNQLRIFNFKMLCFYTILIFFIVPRNFQDYFRIFFSATFILINIIYILANRIEVKVTIKDFILYSFLLFIYIIAIITTPYSIVFTTSILLNFIMIIMSIVSEKDINNITNGKINKTIYIVSIVSIIVQLILGKYYTFNGKLSLAIIGDKNYSGVVAVLFFMYCDKNNFKIGKLIAIVAICLFQSRAALGMIAIFYVTKKFRNSIFNLINIIKLNKTYRLFMAMFIVSVLISYFWVNVIAKNGVEAYQESFNDASNKTRFASNIYAIEQFKENKGLIIYGYDESFSQVAGISNENPYLHNTFMGVRIVQPHNSILNILIKTGIAFSLVYFYILSQLIDAKYTRDNLEYIVPYLINAMFLHRLLDTKFLIFWIIILCLPNNSKILLRKNCNLINKKA